MRDAKEAFRNAWAAALIRNPLQWATLDLGSVFRRAAAGAFLADVAVLVEG